MEPAIPLDMIPTLPQPYTLAQAITVSTMEATGKVPYTYQVRTTIALFNGRDVLCIAGTGSGKTLAFVMLCFLRKDVIVWIISPLNFIENQQCEQFRAWGLSAVSVNASTITPGLLEDIKAGMYQIIISSPESYLDSNKLRPALLSKDLESFFHVTAFDEAHCIKTWGDNFRKDYARSGDLRAFMLRPDESPVIAATATASPPVKKAIVSALKLKDYHLENLGNFRANLCFGIHKMRAGQKSYAEVCDLLPPAHTPLSEVKQTIVFVDDYLAGHSVADAVRKYFGLTGEEARNLVPVYHSLKSDLSKRQIERRFKAGKARILVSTEALTMGADFPLVELVINYLAPESSECALQRAGRGARSKGIICRVFIMVTSKMIKDAASMCEEAGIEVSADLLNIKVEEEALSDQDDTPEHEEAPQDVQPLRKGKKKATGRYQMTLGVAELLVTEGCLVEVLDREFSNPPHEPCYDVGGCYNCMRKRDLAEDQDRLAAERLAKREQVELSIHQYDGESEHLKHKPKQAKENVRQLKESRVFKDAIQIWREDTYIKLLDEMDICLDAFMSDKELEKISKFKITSIESFDDPTVRWPGHLEWRSELLQVLLELEESEARKVAKQAERAQQDRERKALAKEEDRERKALAKEEARQNTLKKRASRVKAPAKAPSTPLGSTPLGALPDSETDASGSLFFPTPPAQSRPFFPNTPLSIGAPTAHTSSLPQGRPVSAIRLGPDGLPIPLRPPLTPALSALYDYPSPITPTTSTFSIPGYPPVAGPSRIAGTSHLATASTSHQTPVRFMDPIVYTHSTPTTHSQQPLETPSRRRSRKLKTPGELQFKMYTGPLPEK